VIAITRECDGPQGTELEVMASEVPELEVLFPLQERIDAENSQICERASGL
jgi:hypothetical protein